MVFPSLALQRKPKNQLVYTKFREQSQCWHEGLDIPIYDLNKD